MHVNIQQGEPLGHYRLKVEAQSQSRYIMMFSVHVCILQLTLNDFIERSNR